MEVPKPKTLLNVDGKKFKYYPNTTVYHDHDQFLFYEAKSCESYEEVYDKMKKLGSVACIKYGDKGNTFIIKSPEGSKHMINIKNGKTQKYPKGGGGDYESIIRNLKHSNTTIKKNIKTFVIESD